MKSAAGTPATCELSRVSASSGWVSQTSLQTLALTTGSHQVTSYTPTQPMWGNGHRAGYGVAAGTAALANDKLMLEFISSDHATDDLVYFARFYFVG